MNKFVGIKNLSNLYAKIMNICAKPWKNAILSTRNGAVDETKLPVNIILQKSNVDKSPKKCG